ncbi:MAG: hypothetical protein LBJ00_08165 [Planctomycetaceae bacterium]|jgi:hypothetical protein|nr:hypothetical protein [Planctomycetaceae bacterium]
MEIAQELGNDQPNLSDEKFNIARTQILKDYLSKNDISLNQIQMENYESGFKNFVLRDEHGGNKSDSDSLVNLLNELPELGWEIQAYIEQANATQPKDTIAKKEDSVTVRPLLSMKRGVLSEASNTELDFGSHIGVLTGKVSNQIVSKVNEIFSDAEDLQIRDYKLKINSAGRLSITDVRTKGNDPEANLRAAALMNHMIDADMQDFAKDLGMAILDAHDDEHGDVAEYKHDVIIGSGIKGRFKIESKEADEAAMREIESLTNDIGSFLGDFFEKTLNISNLFSIVFNSNSFQLLDADSLSSQDANAVQQVLEDLNKFLISDETEDESDDELPSKYAGIGDKLIALKEAQGKLHDKSLLPKEGIRFTF